jgi:hypothetical protein
LTLENLVNVFGPDSILELEDFWSGKGEKSDTDTLKATNKLKEI